MKCPINSQTPEEPIKAPQGSKGAKAVLSFYEDLRKRGGVISDAGTIEVALQKEFGVLLNSAATIPVLTKYSKIENVLATLLGYKSHVLNAIDLSMTEAGSTRYLLQTKAKEASKVLQIAALNKAMPKINELYGELKKAMPTTSLERVQELLHDHVIIGQFSKLNNIYDSPLVRQQLAKRYQEHIERLVKEGVKPTTIKTIDVLSGEISQSFDNARAIASKYGFDLKQLQNGGYFPIQTTTIAEKFLEAANETGRSNQSKQVFDTAKMLNASRTSTMPAVLDLLKTAQVLGVSTQELSEMLTSPGSISVYLKKRFTQETLEKLYNNGTLVQIPALSDELFTMFNEELNLPIANLGQALILDPIRAVKRYNQELTKAVENSSMVQLTIEEGVRNGWVVDYSVIKNSPNVRDYVKIGSDKLYQELFKSDKLRESIANLYIHRTVNDQLKALTKANTSLITLGLMGQGLQTFLKFTSFTKRSLITAAGLPYIGRVFAQNCVSLNAATGSLGMFHYAKGLAEVGKTFVSKNTEHLSSEVFAKVGDKDFSLRELFDTTFVRRDTSNVSITGEKFDAGDSGDKLKESFGFLFGKEQSKVFTKQMEIYHQRYGSPVTGLMLDRAGMLAEMFNSASKQAYEVLAKGNQMLDFAARWTAVRSLALDPSLAGKTGWKDVDELLRYTDEYFNVNEDTGELGQTIGQYLVPFAQFALVAPGVTVRHALRHPWRYGRMISLYAQANASSDLTDAELTDYQKSSYPLFIGRDPETNKRWSINPGGIDSFLDTTTWAEQNFGKIARGFNQPVGSFSQQINVKVDPMADVEKSLNELFSRVYLTKAISAAALGIDPSTGEKFSNVPASDTLLGIGINRQLRSVLTEALPILRTLDRTLPTSVVGSSTVVNPATYAVERTGTPSWTGSYPTTGGTPKDKQVEKAGILLEIVNGSGVTLSQFDPSANLIRNYKDFGFKASELQNAANSLQEKINSRPPGVETDNLKEQRKRLLQLQGLVEYNKMLVDNLAISKGYPLPKALDMVRSKLTSEGDIPNEAKLEFLKQQGVK